MGYKSRVNLDVGDDIIAAVTRHMAESFSGWVFSLPVGVRYDHFREINEQTCGLRSYDLLARVQFAAERAVADCYKSTWPEMGDLRDRDRSHPMVVGRQIFATLAYFLYGFKPDDIAFQLDMERTSVYNMLYSTQHSATVYDEYVLVPLMYAIEQLRQDPKTPPFSLYYEGPDTTSEGSDSSAGEPDGEAEDDAGRQVEEEARSTEVLGV